MLDKFIRVWILEVVIFWCRKWNIFWGKVYNPVSHKSGIRYLKTNAERLNKYQYPCHAMKRLLFALECHSTFNVITPLENHFYSVACSRHLTVVLLSCLSPRMSSRPLSTPPQPDQEKQVTSLTVRLGSLLTIVRAGLGWAAMGALREVPQPTQTDGRKRQAPRPEPRWPLAIPMLIPKPPSWVHQSLPGHTMCLTDHLPWLRPVLEVVLHCFQPFFCL